MWLSESAIFYKIRLFSVPIDHLLMLDPKAERISCLRLDAESRKLLNENNKSFTQIATRAAVEHNKLSWHGELSNGERGCPERASGSGVSVIVCILSGGIQEGDELLEEGTKRTNERSQRRHHSRSGL